MFLVPVPKLPFDTKFLSDTKFLCDVPADNEIHTFVLKATNSRILASEKVQSVFGWGRGEGGHTYMYVKDVTFRK